MEARNIPVGKLRIRNDARPVDQAALSALIESVSEIGFTSSILVRPKIIFESGQEAEGYEVIAGRHRFEAAQKLGMAEMPCRVGTLDDIRAEMAMLDENLRRVGYTSPAAEAQAIARRKELYEALHPEAKVGSFNQHTVARRQVGEEQPARFTAATAGATGKTERSVQRAAERGKSISEQALDRIAGTHLDRGNYLDKLKVVPKEEQADRVARDLAAPRKPISPAPAVRNEYESYQAFLNKVVKLFDGVPLEWRQAACEHVLADEPIMDRGAA